MIACISKPASNAAVEAFQPAEEEITVKVTAPRAVLEALALELTLEFHRKGISYVSEKIYAEKATRGY